MTQEEDFIALLGHFKSVTSSLKGQVVEKEWMIYVNGVGIKLFRHVSSLYSLYQGTKLQFGPNQFLDFVDYGSINVLTRAAFETALAFHFIFCEPADIEEREFRFMCWDYAGFLERQGFPTISDEGREVKVTEAKAMGKVKLEIQAHSSFERYTKKQQKKILDGEWRLGQSWTSIAVAAGYSEKYFKSIYSLLCGYAHTGRLSVLQIQQAKTKVIQKELADVCIGYSCIIMSNFLFGYSSLFPIADRTFRSNLPAFNVAQMWRNIGQEISVKNNGG